CRASHWSSNAAATSHAVSVLPWYPPPLIIRPARVVGLCLRALVWIREPMIRDTAALIGVSWIGRFAWVAARCRSCRLRRRRLGASWHGPLPAASAFGVDGRLGGGGTLGPPQRDDLGRCGPVGPGGAGAVRARGHGLGGLSGVLATSLFGRLGRPSVDRGGL